MVHRSRRVSPMIEICHARSHISVIAIVLYGFDLIETDCAHSIY